MLAPRVGDPPARVPAHARGGRRSRRADGHRDRVHQARLRRRRSRSAVGLFARAAGAALCARGAAPASIASAVGAVGRDVQVGHRSGHRGTRGRAGDQRVPTRPARISSARPRSPVVPRAAHAGAGALGPASVLSAISPNERLQYNLHPWTSYVIVPLFALANAGDPRHRRLLSDAITRRSRSGSRRLHGRQAARASSAPRGSPPARPAGRAPGQLAGARRRRRVAGIGFTVSLLISSLAFTGERLDEAKLGVLGSVIVAPILAWVVLR